MRAFVDANILVDVLIGRAPFDVPAAAIWALAESGRVDAVASAVSFTNIYYIIRKGAGHAAAADEAVRKVAAVFDVAAVDRQVVSEAIASRMPDFEDAVQLYAALKARATHIVTRDPREFTGAPIPVMSPEAFHLSIPARP